MIGSRIGSKSRFTGSIVGSSGDDEGESGAVPGVSRDATSLIYVPASAAEWTAFRAAFPALSAWSNPDALHLCQEAAGNLADSIGVLTLTAGGTPLYQQAVAGWDRDAASFDDNTTDNFSTTAAALPNILTESMLSLGFFRFPAAPAGVREIIHFGAAATRAAIELPATGVLRARSGGNTADGALSMVNATHPLVLKQDRTAGTTKVYSAGEIITPAFDALTSGENLRIGQVAGNPPAFGGGCLYLATWYLAAAERSDADIRSMLQSLGFSPTW